MSTFTKFLNLFKWQPDIDGDEEFDIEKSLNENWDKVDTKLETYMTDLTNDVENYKNDTDTQINNFTTDITNKVNELEGEVSSQKEISISPTAPTSNESVWIKKGKNRFNNWEQGGINQTTGEYMTATARLRTVDFVDIVPNVDYYISVEDTNYCFLNIILYDKEDNFVGNYLSIDSSLNGATSLKVVFPSTCAKIKAVLRHTDNTTTMTTDLIATIKPQLEQNSKKTDYEPYIEKEIYVKNDNGVFERFYTEYNEKDSGWITATLTNAFKAYTTGTDVKYRKVGKIVEIKGILTPTSDITGSSSTVEICTIPEGFRPSDEINVISQATSTNIWLLSITANGKLYFQRHRKGADYATCVVGNWLPLHIMFFVD